MTDDDVTAPQPRANPYLIGHAVAESDYLSAWSGGRLAHAWLIAGPRGIGKATLAYRMARFALAQQVGSAEADMFGGLPPPQTLEMSASHPVFRRVQAMGHSDFRSIERLWSDAKQTKRKTVIGVDEVREIGGFLSMTPAEGAWRALVIDAADEMNNNAANAVLKILEEPPDRALLFLVVHNADRLLPTIRSRCRRLDLRPLTQIQVGTLIGRYRPDIKSADVTPLAILADGSIGRALELADEGGIGLFRNLIDLLQDAPKFNISKLHALGDQATKGDAFRTLMGLLSWWLARVATQGAQDTLQHAPDIIPGERTASSKLAAAASPAVWADIWQQITHLANRTEAINLDKKRSILTALMKVESAAKV
ncbi:MAG: DNA polymerase III subunit delta' [Alphaproteobacteria bacterium]|nr:DNA polymerase III subunit delta' [Alphaproteobacteria bacterium]PHX98525.1 MAG: DNA polymerase III subunit delta' [Rhodospirillaceae bacterium]